MTTLIRNCSLNNNNGHKEAPMQRMMLAAIFAASLLVTLTGCELSTGADNPDGDNTVIDNTEVHVILAHVDSDGDGAFDGEALPGEDTHQLACNEAIASGVAEAEDECLRVVRPALRNGVTDCDSNRLNDPDHCYDADTGLYATINAELDALCADEEDVDACEREHRLVTGLAICAPAEDGTRSPFSDCAPCIDSNATEVFDGVDNNCDGSIDEGVDPCEGITCEEPPAPTCDGDFVVSYPSIGVCELGECSYEATTADEACEFGCTEGACNPDPCDGVSCEAPADSCVDGTFTSYSDAGVCSEGVCDFSTVMNTEVCEFGCNAEGTACAGDPCDGVVCDAPPADTCDGDFVVTYSDAGVCNAGECTYLPATADEACEFGCSEGACLPSPCEGVTCDEAPVPTCADAFSITTYEGTGTCEDSTGSAVCDYSSLAVTTACDPGLGCFDPEDGSGAACGPVPCDPEIDAEWGEEWGDCYDFRPSDEYIESLGGGTADEYGFGCHDPAETGTGTCVLYEDKDSDEAVDDDERYCADFVDGNLDTEMDICAEGYLCGADGICRLPSTTLLMNVDLSSTSTIPGSVVELHLLAHCEDGDTVTLEWTPESPLGTASPDAEGITATRSVSGIDSCYVNVGGWNGSHYVWWAVERRGGDSDSFLNADAVLDYSWSTFSVVSVGIVPNGLSGGNWVFEPGVDSDGDREPDVTDSAPFDGAVE
jgi:hypothetical protein